MKFNKKYNHYDYLIHVRSHIKYRKVAKGAIDASVLNGWSGLVFDKSTISIFIKSDLQLFLSVHYNRSSPCNGFT